jgi:hypothetical protein
MWKGYTMAADIAFFVLPTWMKNFILIEERERERERGRGKVLASSGFWFILSSIFFLSV